MPDLTLPSPYPFTASTEVTASGLNTVLYNDASPTSALNIVNGYLNRTNLDASLSIGPEMTQRGSIVDAWSVAGTANLDYTSYHFGANTETTTLYVSKPNTSKPIPGGCRRIYLARQSLVRVSWTVFFTSDNTTGSERSRIFMYTNGVAEDAQRRQLTQTSVGGTPTAPAGSITHYGYRKNRHWSGHHQRLLAAGWHDIGLRIQSSFQVRQTRIWCRHMDIVAFTL